MKFIKSVIAAGALLSVATGALSQELVMYTSNPLPVVEKAQELVKDQLGANLSVVSGGSSTLLRRIEAEGAAPAANLFWTSSVNAIASYEEYFEAYSSPEIEAMAPEFRYPGDKFQPSSINVVAVMLNNDYLEGLERPTKWEDLAAPEWAGKIIMPNPESSSTGYTIIWGLSKLLDKETYEKIIANTVIAESARRVPQSVAAGEYVLGLTFEASPYDYVANGSTEIEIIYPEDGTFNVVEYAGIIKNDNNLEAAKKAIDVILSKQAQIEILQTGYRRPTRMDVRVSDYLELPEFSDIVIFQVDEREAASAREAFLAEWRALPKSN